MIEKLPSRLLEKAVDQLSTLPGVGRKTALRLALFFLRQPSSFGDAFAKAISELCNDIVYCNKCHNVSDFDTCAICSDSKRDTHTICVVESVRDVMAIESTAQYNGLYHVLGGLISPVDGIAPSDLQINSLVERVATEEIHEIILALSSTMDGDTTNFFLFRKLQSAGIKISVIARGIAIGDELEYADELTLGRSILNRTSFDDSIKL